MKRINISRENQRLIRSKRISKKFANKVNTIPYEIIVNKTDKHIYVQLVDTNNGKTLFSISTLSLKLPKKIKESAAKVGEEFAKKAIAQNIKQVRFNRNGYPYHGIVEVIADTCRKQGLEF